MPFILFVIMYITSPTFVINRMNYAGAVRAPVVLIGRFFLLSEFIFLIYYFGKIVNVLGEAEKSKQKEQEAVRRAQKAERDLEQHRLLTSAIPKKHLIAKGPFTMNTQSVQAFFKNDNLQLTPKEFALLLFFIQHENETVSREEIFEKIWQMPLTDKDNSLNNTVSRLRGKIIHSEYRITAVRKKGYRFEKDDCLK
ncbi:hypothetical protein NRIC_36980 [Enterococcus florum]|uniref:OmpR/PhoB-type domain-containing protein n=2 Tax=Enterococcus florum TaxID=2480627 RepID=A0A4P5PC69_9ENTE|nr:hypothetical protein NRIC_36980 [Enterococcus florum]